MLCKCAMGWCTFSNLPLLCLVCYLGYASTTAVAGLGQLIDRAQSGPQQKWKDKKRRTCRTKTQKCKKTLKKMEKDAPMSAQSKKRTKKEDNITSAPSLSSTTPEPSASLQSDTPLYSTPEPSASLQSNIPVSEPPKRRKITQQRKTKRKNPSTSWKRDNLKKKQSTQQQVNTKE